MKNIAVCILAFLMTFVIGYYAFITGFNKGAEASSLTIGARVENKLNVQNNLLLQETVYRDYLQGNSRSNELLIVGTL